MLRRIQIRWESFKKVHPKKVIAKKQRKNWLFSTFTTKHQSFWLITFFGWTFMKLSQRIWTWRKILRFFYTQLDFFKNKNFWALFRTFLKFWSLTRMQGLKIGKNAFSKHVLELNLASISALVFSTFSKKVKITAP